MTTAMKNQLATVIMENRAAHVHLEKVDAGFREARAELVKAQNVVEDSDANLARLLCAIEPSDAPSAEPVSTRKRRKDAGISRTHAEGCTCVKCDPAPKTLSGIPGDPR